MTRGLYLGKFMPVHTGHEYVMNYAAELVDDLVIVLGSRESDPLEPLDRLLELKTMCPKNARILHLHKNLPQLPEEDPENFWNIWEKELTNLVGKVDMVFGGEAYINTLAKVLGAEPMIVDRTKHSIGISATKVRNMSLTQRWRYIPRGLRPYYKLNVCLLGPESTGKSTLTKNLAEIFNEPVYAYEYGREYALKGTREWVREDFDIIRSRQEALRAATEKTCEMICFSDTDTLQTSMWEKYLMGTTNTHKLDSIKKPDLYLLMSPDVPFIQDGERYQADQEVRESFYTMTKDTLESLELNYVEILGRRFNTRLVSAINAINNLV